MKSGDILVHKLNRNFRVVYIGRNGIGFRGRSGTLFIGRSFNEKKKKIEEDVYVEEEFEVLEPEKTVDKVIDSEIKEKCIGVICPTFKVFNDFVYSSVTNRDILNWENPKKVQVIHSSGTKTTYKMIYSSGDCIGMIFDSWTCLFSDNEHDARFIDNLPMTIRYILCSCTCTNDQKI